MNARRTLPLLSAACVLFAGSCASADRIAPDERRLAVPDHQRPTTSSPASRPASRPGSTPARSPGPTSPKSADRCASQVLSGLDLRGRVGQLLVIGVPAAHPGIGARTVGRYRLGGVFLTGRSRSGVVSTRRGVKRLQSAAAASGGVRLVVAVDQEGGRVQTLAGSGFSTISPANAQGNWPPATLASRSAATARQLRSAGVTMNLAPVADTVPAGTERRNRPIGALGRNYGSTPYAVARRVGVVVSALENGGIATTLKHFPGLGRVRLNTDNSAGAADPLATSRDLNLRPFRAGVAAGASVVMISSASYPRLDRHQPAVSSHRIINGLLRGQMGYRGVVISDDLGAAVAVQGISVGERAARFIDAGGDLVLSVRTADARRLAAALTRKAERDDRFRRRVDAAALRILTLKAASGLMNCGGSYGK